MQQGWLFLQSDGIALSMLGFLFLVALAAGFIDTLAGGGGLLTIPALMACGVPPLMALGTNKLQGSVGTAMASFVMVRSGHVQLARVRLWIVTALVGATCGTLLVQQLHTQWLSWIIPVVLVGIGGYFLFAPAVRPHRQPRCSDRQYSYGVIPLIGGYDGFFGPGTGSFFALAGVSLQGYNIVQATAISKLLNCASNLAALVVFLLAGQLLWSAAVVMLAGQLIGAWCGAHTLFRINPNYLRYLVVVMSLAMLAHYLLS